MMTKKTEIINFVIDKECKHSRRYLAPDKNAVIKTVYIKKPFADGVDKFEITIKEKRNL